MKEIKIRKINDAGFLGKLEVVDLGELLKAKTIAEELHRHDFLFLMVLEEASGTHQIDFSNYPIESTSVSIIRPGQVHELMLTQGTKGYAITFDLNFYPSQSKKESFWKITQSNYRKLDTEPFNTILSVSKRIHEEYTHKKFGYEDMIKANLDILFLELYRYDIRQHPSSEKTDQYEQELLQKFIRLLEKGIYEKKQVIQYSDELQITPYKLNKITKNLLGKTSSELINDQTILEAKRMLLATSNQVKEIAYKLCYYDPAYFNRFFKKYTGYTPQAFRQNFR